MDAKVMSNDRWIAEIADPSTGRLTGLIDKKSGQRLVGDTRADGDVLAEGGHSRLGGLDCWVKSGSLRDWNTGVLAKWSPLRNADMKVKENNSHGVTLESSAGGLTFTLSWELADGEAPLLCKAD